MKEALTLLLIAFCLAWMLDVKHRSDVAKIIFEKGSKIRREILKNKVKTLIEMDREGSCSH